MNLADRIVACERCPRLREHCREVAATKRRAYRDEEYWGQPIPYFGPASAQRYAKAAAQAATIFWNGPMGVFEMDAFAKGTEAVAEAVAASAAVSVVGGGDSLAAVNKMGVGDRISHLSTGGGAALEYVQGLELPGVAALVLNETNE